MKTLADLQLCNSTRVLRKALLEICADYGEIQRLEILKAVHEGRHQAICFLTMNSPAQEAELMRSLGVGRFGGEIVFVVEMDHAPEDDGFGVSSEWFDLGTSPDEVP